MDEITRELDAASRALAQAEAEWTSAYSHFRAVNDAVGTHLRVIVEDLPGRTQERVETLRQEAGVEAQGIVEDLRADVTFSANRSTSTWDDPRWEMVRSLAAGESPSALDERFNLAAEVDSALFRVGALPEVSVPAFLPNVTLEHVTLRADHQVVVPVVETLLVRLLTTTPNVKVHVLDPEHHGRSLARFALANTDRPDLGQVFAEFVTDHPGVQRRLDVLSQHVTSVSHRLLRGERTLQEHNASSDAKEPVQVLVALDVDSYSRHAREALDRLATNPDGSVIVVQHHSVGSEVPRSSWHLDTVEGSLRLAGWQVEDVVAPPKVLVEGAVRWAEALQRLSVRSVELRDLLPVRWQPVGPDLRAVVGSAGTAPFEVALGVQSDPHMVVIGESGSGKSTFLHALVTSLAATYSPEDLSFVLLDGKEGVEMSAYVPGPNRLSFLPHVQVAAVNTDIRMYVSVLENLKEEIRLRNQLFREAGAVDILDYKARTGRVMPRLVALMDEFQVLMQEGRHQSTVVGLLADVARRGRSAGIHLVLATQTLRGINAVALGAALDQITNRVALRCDSRNSEMVLGDGNTAAADLVGKGQAILNVGRVAPERNQPFQVGYLSPGVRDEVVDSLNQRAATGCLAVPVVLQGGESVSVTQAGLLDFLANPADPSLCLGGPLSVRGPVWGDFTSENRRNVVFLGSDDPTGMLVASTLALAAAKPEARILVCESRFRTGSAAHVTRLVEVLRNAGRDVSFLESRGSEEQRPGHVVKLLAKEVTQAAKDGAWVNDDRGVFLVVPDGRAIPNGALKEVLDAGPERGVQVVVQASTMRMLADVATGSNIVTAKPLEPFGLRVLTNLEPASNARNLIGDVQSRHPNGEEGRNTFQSVVDNEEVCFIPVTTPTADEWSAIEDLLRRKP